jgi:hypothetical protein
MLASFLSLREHPAFIGPISDPSMMPGMVQSHLAEKTNHTPWANGAVASLEAERIRYKNQHNAP